MLIPILLPLIKIEFSLSYAQSGFLLSGYIGMRSIFSYVSGHLGDKYDKRVIISTGFIFTSIFLIFFARANSIYSITGTLLLLGIAISTFHPLATALVGGEAVSEHRAFYIGVFESTGVLGIILATVTFGLLLESWGWRKLLFALSIPGFVIAWYYIKSAKAIIKKNVAAEYEVSKRNIFLFIVARGVRSLGIGAIFSFLPIFATDQIGFSAANSSWLMSVMFTGIIIGSLYGGWYSDRSSPLLIIFISMYSIILAIIAMTYVNIDFLYFLLAFMFGIAQGGFFTTQNCWLTQVSTAETRGRIMGFAFLIDGFSVTVAPTLFGCLADSAGLVVSYRLTAVPVIISLLLYFILSKNIKKSRVHV